MNPVKKALAILVCGFGFLSAPALAQDKPNILVIMTDDVGIPNISVYSHGMMGYQTPNIDRIAREGVLFTDYYGNRAARRAARFLLPGSTSFVLAFRKSACPAPMRESCLHT